MGSIRFINEARYKYILKEYFGRTNKRDIFQEQFLFYNERRLNIFVIKDVLLYDNTNQISIPKNILNAFVICPNRNFFPLTLFNKRL